MARFDNTGFNARRELNSFERARRQLGFEQQDLQNDFSLNMQELIAKGKATAAEDKDKQTATGPDPSGALEPSQNKIGQEFTGGNADAALSAVNKAIRGEGGPAEPADEGVGGRPSRQLSKQAPFSGDKISNLLGLLGLKREVLSENKEFQESKDRSAFAAGESLHNFRNGDITAEEHKDQMTRATAGLNPQERMEQARRAQDTSLSLKAEQSRDNREAGKVYQSTLSKFGIRDSAALSRAAQGLMAATKDEDIERFSGQVAELVRGSDVKVAERAAIKRQTGLDIGAAVLNNLRVRKGEAELRNTLRAERTQLESVRLDNFNVTLGLTSDLTDKNLVDLTSSLLLPNGKPKDIDASLVQLHTLQFAQLQKGKRVTVMAEEPRWVGLGSKDVLRDWDPLEAERMTKVLFGELEGDKEEAVTFLYGIGVDFFDQPNGVTKPGFEKLGDIFPGPEQDSNTWKFSGRQGPDGPVVNKMIEGVILEIEFGAKEGITIDNRRTFQGDRVGRLPGKREPKALPTPTVVPQQQVSPTARGQAGAESLAHFVAGANEEKNRTLGARGIGAQGRIGEGATIKSAGERQGAFARRLLDIITNKGQ